MIDFPIPKILKNSNVSIMLKLRRKPVPPSLISLKALGGLRTPLGQFWPLRRNCSGLVVEHSEEECQNPKYLVLLT